MTRALAAADGATKMVFEATNWVRFVIAGSALVLFGISVWFSHWFPTTHLWWFPAGS